MRTQNSLFVNRDGFSVRHTFSKAECSGALVDDRWARFPGKLALQAIALQVETLIFGPHLLNVAEQVLRGVHVPHVEGESPRQQ